MLEFFKCRPARLDLGELGEAIVETDETAVDLAGKRLEVVGVLREVIDHPERTSTREVVGVGRKDIGGTQDYLGALDHPVACHDPPDSFVVGSSRDLDCAPSSEVPTVVGVGLVTHSSVVDSVGDLLGLAGAGVRRGVGCAVWVGKAGAPRSRQSLGGVVEILDESGEPRRLVGTLGNERLSHRRVGELKDVELVF